jgi:hypothetical protein
MEFGPNCSAEVIASARPARPARQSQWRHGRLLTQFVHSFADALGYSVKLSAATRPLERQLLASAVAHYRNLKDSIQSIAVRASVLRIGPAPRIVIGDICRCSGRLLDESV